MRQIEPDDGEVVYARGRSPHAPAENPPYELDFMLRHRVGTTDAPLVSRFTNLIEAGQSLEIEDAQPIDVDGVTGVRLSIGGMTHYVLRGDGSDVAREVARGVVFAGNMGFIERDDAGLRRAVLVGEGKLTLDGQGIRRSPDDWRGSIGEVDCANRTIQVEADTPPPEGVVGQYVLVSRARPGEGGADTFAYRVEEMTPAGSGRWSLRLNWSPLIGEGTVRETTERGFMSATQLGLASSRVYYRFAHVVTGDSSVRARIGHVHSDTQIEGGEVILRADDQHLASRFSSGTAFTIEEIGPGDAVRLPAWAEIVRREDGTWARAASGPADIATE